MNWDDVTLQKTEMLRTATADLKEGEIKLLHWLLKEEKRRRDSRGRNIANELANQLATIFPESK